MKKNGKKKERKNEATLLLFGEKYNHGQKI